MVAEQVETERLLFVDEMGTNTSLSPVYAWAKKGQRAYWSVPRNRGANTTVLSSMSLRGMGPSLTVEGATDTVVFEAYVDRKSTRLNSSHANISYAVFCLKKKKQ